jgi:hypothetical protein
LQPAHCPDAIFYLIEAIVNLRAWELELSPEIELIRPECPGDTTFRPSNRGMTLDQRDSGAAFLHGRFTHEMMFRILRESHWNHRTPQDGRPEPVQVIQGLLQHHSIVHPGRQHDLSMEFNSVRCELAELRDDLRSGRVPQEVAPDGRIRGMH